MSRTDPQKPAAGPGGGDLSRQEIIAAPATPRGRSALAMVRLSGRGCGRLAEGLMRLPEGALSRGRMRRVGHLYGPDGRVDRVVAFLWEEGASYTGEEMVEICCHGVPDRVDAVLEALLEAGARRAEAGEFTRRALLSGRMSPLEVMELAAMQGKEATSPAGALAEGVREALEAASGALEELEGEIEFGGEHPDVGVDAEGALGMLAERLERAASTVGRAEGERRIMVMGPPNSGKSTFLNRLVGRELALVHSAPGTTRDGAGAVVEMRGSPVLVTDSAGAGDSGMDARAYRMAAESVDDETLVVWMESGPEPQAPEELRRRAASVMEVSSRADLYPGGKRRLSLVSGEGWESTVEDLAEWASAGSLAAEVAGLAERARRAMEMVAGGEYGMAAAELTEAERGL
ncbi:MAG: GTPase, partial [Candidatus Fermentibacterota bacterium]